MSNFPSVEYVTYDSKPLPKLGVVKFRPFIVGEHRRLLEAVELGSPESVLNTMSNIVKDCTFGKVDPEKTEMYLVDALYLEIYIRSRGSVNQAVYKCTNVVNDAPCGGEVLVNMPLDRAYLHIPEGYKESEIIRISPKAGFKLRQATLEDYKKIKSDGAYSLTDEFIFASIECIFDGDRVMTPGTDYDLKSLSEYLDTLPDTIMQDMTQFFENSPSLKLELDVTCPKCGNAQKLKLSGLDDFFV